MIMFLLARNSDDMFVERMELIIWCKEHLNVVILIALLSVIFYFQTIRNYDNKVTLTLIMMNCVLLFLSVVI